MMRSERFISSLFWCCVSIVCSGCDRYSQELPPNKSGKEAEKPELVSRPASPDQHFAGSQSCQECHEEIVALFAKHPMGKSAGSLATGPVVANYEIAHFLTNDRLAYSAIKKEDGTIIHREEKLYRQEKKTSVPEKSSQRNKTGNTNEPDQQTAVSKSVYQLDHVVEYYLGSGQRGRSYLLQKEGLLFQSPITWYSSAKRWGLSPGYSVRNPHFERRIVDGCITCHVGRINTDPQKRENIFVDSPDQKIIQKTDIEGSAAHAAPQSSRLMIEAAISCERCHGPAAKHVAYQQGTSQEHPIERDPILLINEMDSRQRESLCNQCHLVGANRILRYARTEYDFRPGDNLSDIWITFVKGTGVKGSTTEAVSHVEQMHSSACYQGSQGKMDCTSCHDPHMIPDEKQRVSFYRNKCLACHSENKKTCSMLVESRLKKTPEDSCIVCHMPSLNASDVPHTSQTDHRVLKAPLNKSFTPARAASEKLVIHDHAEKILPKQAVNRAKAILMAIYAQQDNDVYLARAASQKLEPLLEIYSDDVHLLIKIGIMERLYGSKPKAKEYLEKVLLLKPQQEEALLQLGLLCSEMQDFEKGISYLQSYLEINPWDRNATGRQIHMLGLTDQFQQGIQKAEQALLKFPGDWRIHGWLVDAYQNVGRLEESKKHAEIYEQVKPGSR